MTTDPRLYSPGSRPRAALVAALLALATATGACADAPAEDEAMHAGALDVLAAAVTSGVCPSGSTTFGIDVSKWQGTINWASVKSAGVKFAIIRVSDGTGYSDSQFTANWSNAKAQGILRGAYQFFRSNQDPIAQADLLISRLNTYGRGELPPVIDVETTDGQSPATVASRVGQWLNRVKSQLGVTPIVYTGSYFWESNVQSSAYSSYPLWIAHWTSGCPTIPSAWSGWKFHQYSDSGSVSGISGAVDLNRFNGSLSQLQAWAGTTVTPTGPKVSIDVRTASPSGQAADFRPEGSSSGILDLYEGQTFTSDVLVTNAATAAVATSVHVGVWFESPWLIPASYTIYTDWPHKDKATWSVNDANGNTANPAHTNPPASAKYELYAFSPGETKMIRFSVRAAQYSIGAVDHPDVRSWVWHVANWYGEQTSWNDAVETNNAGTILRDYWQHDVFARDRWTFEGPNAADTEGWGGGHSLAALAVNTTDHALALQMGGSDPYVKSGPALIDAAQKKGVKLRVRTFGGDKLSQLYFVTAADGAWNDAKAKRFIAPGDGAFHALTVDMSDVPGWAGTVTQLRLDPSASGTDWYDLDELTTVASVAETSGDADGDGALAAPGPDCDDGDAAVGPGRAEVCDGRDNDCNGTVDDGFDIGGACTVGVGGCAALGTWECSADGAATVCDAEALAPRTEVCNGVDDDCDGTTDEDGCGAICLPGVTGPCVLLDAPAGCEIGVRACVAGGGWSDCELAPGCGTAVVADEDEGDVVEGADGATTADGGGGDASVDGGAVGGGPLIDVHLVTRRADEGCAGGAGGATPWLLLGALLGLAILRRRRRA
jgi:GH25 family lysozyme M1 (1,4-beta-N-acetylmuramidase)